MSQRISGHTLKVLEYDAFRRILASFTASELGRMLAEELYPSIDRQWIKTRQKETSEMKHLLEQDIRIPMAGIKDIRPLLRQIGSKQTVFEAEQILTICETLGASSQLRYFFHDLGEQQAGSLKQMSRELENFDDIIDKVNSCIDPEKSIRDTASEQLYAIRRRLNEVHTELRRKFDKIVSRPEMKNALANENILTRNGRVVVLLKANYHQHLRGMVLDRSKSGAALYIEPYELAELNNQLEDARYEEKKEVWRILYELTHSILSRRADIIKSLKVLARVDLTYAKARFSLAYKMAEPDIGDDLHLHIRQGRHPLLLEFAAQRRNTSISAVMDEIVPIDVRLGDDFDMLLITGPNTGGKTVTLKTIGLLVLMVQSGMHIPAWSESRMPVYRQVFADIGDEQSIRQSLSTFSAHLKQIVDIQNRAGNHSLVLLDELGSGTDPAEGAALGAAILDSLRRQKAHVVATTHLGQLKHYAYTTERVQNASVRFDAQTLQPTFELMIGTPGSSNALAIARKLGMPHKIIANARSRLVHKDKANRDLLNKVQQTRQMAEHDRKKAQEMLDAVKAMYRVAAERLDRTAERRTELMEQADRAIDESMSRVRTLVNGFAAEMQNAPKPWSEKTARFKEQMDKAAASTTLALRHAKFIEGLRVGDRVYLKPFQRDGIVQRIHRKRQNIVVLSGGREMTLPFSEIRDYTSRLR